MTRMKIAVAIAAALMTLSSTQAATWMRMARSNYLIDIESIDVQTDHIAFDTLQDGVQARWELDCGRKRLRIAVQGMRATPWLDSPNVSQTCAQLMRIYRERRPL